MLLSALLSLRDVVLVSDRPARNIQHVGSDLRCRDGPECALCCLAGSGKTHTMEGPAQDRGVNYRTLEDLFGVAEARGAETDYSFYVSLIEVNGMLKPCRDTCWARVPAE